MPIVNFLVCEIFVILTWMTDLVKSQFDFKLCPSSLVITRKFNYVKVFITMFITGLSIRIEKELSVINVISVGLYQS